MRSVGADQTAHVGLLDRPLSPRSLVASLLLGMDPPRIRGADLVSWCELFGVAEGTTRVALSRMVDGGELTTADARYELCGSLDLRRSRQNIALSDRRGAWSGEWEMYLVRPGSRRPDQRSALRRAMATTHRVELRDGVWTRPANLAEPIDAQADLVIRDQCDRWVGRPETEVVAAELFDLAPWSTRARALCDVVDGCSALLPAPEVLPRAFYGGAAAVDQIRRDPRLPEALLPPDWPGKELRASYRDFQQKFADAVARWLRARRALPASGR